MRLRTPLDLGLIPFRDHREVVGPSAARIPAARVDGRYVPYGYRLTDRAVAEGNTKHVAVEPGDGQGYHFWPPGRTRGNASSTDAIANRRPVGSWWGGPAVGLVVETDDASAVDYPAFGVMTTPASSTNPARSSALAVLPYLDRSLAVDDRYAALRVVADRPNLLRPLQSDTRIRVVLPPPGRELPADYPGIVAAGTEEHAQETLFVPAGGVLVSHWRPVGPNRFSTLCYDVRGSRLDVLHAGPLDSAWRVTALDAADAPQSTDPRYRPPAALAWAGLRAPEHRRAGRGLTAHQDVDLGVPISVIDRTTALGTAPGHLVVNAYHALEGGGALTAGGPECQHRFFQNVDGEDFVPGHLQAGALFWAGDAFDAPLDFQLRPYPEPPAKPYTTRVHLVHDSGSPHRWLAGDPLDRRTGRGLWRWYAETNWGPYTPPPWDGKRPPPITDKPGRRDVPAIPNPPPGKQPPPVPEPDRSGRGERRERKQLWTLGAARAQEKWFRKAGGRQVVQPPRNPPAPPGAKGGQQAGGGAGKPQGKHGGSPPPAPPRRVFGAGVVNPDSGVLGAGQKQEVLEGESEFGGLRGFTKKDKVGAQFDQGQGDFRAGIQEPGRPFGSERRQGDVGLDEQGNVGGAKVVPPGAPRRFPPGVAPIDASAGPALHVAPGLAVLPEAPTFEYTSLELGAPSIVAVPTRSWVSEEDLRYRRSPPSAAEARVNQSAPATGRLAAFGLALRGPQKAPGWEFTHRPWDRPKTLSGTGPGGLAFLPPELGLEDVLCGESPTFHRAREVSATAFALLRTSLAFVDCYDPRYGAVDGHELARHAAGAIALRRVAADGARSPAWGVEVESGDLLFGRPLGDGLSPAARLEADFAAGGLVLGNAALPATLKATTITAATLARVGLPVAPTRGQDVVLEVGDGLLGAASGDVVFRTGSGLLADRGGVIPDVDAAIDFGTAPRRWRTVRAVDVVTGDLHLRGADGDWTIRERADGLEAINNRTGRRFRIALDPVI